MELPRLTLALGGGGARGFAHLGAIEALLEQGFEFDRIVGLSSGSIAGAMFAFDQDIHAIQRRTLQFLLSPQFQKHQATLFGAAADDEDADVGGLYGWYNRVLQYLRGNQRLVRIVTQPALLPGIILHEVVDYLLPDANIEDALIPLSIVTVDLRSGHTVVCERGSLRQAVRASCAVPGMFPPVSIDGMLCCDLGVVNSLPTMVARSYDPQRLVAVDVSSPMKRVAACDTAMEILVRMDEVSEQLCRAQARQLADVLIHPDLPTIEWFDFSNVEQVISAGRFATHQAYRILRAGCDS